MRLLFPWDPSDTLQHNLMLQRIKAVWDKEGAAYIAALKKLTGLGFTEPEITINITDKKSNAGGMGKPVLISQNLKDHHLLPYLEHELLHRLLENNGYVDEYDTKDESVDLAHRKLYILLFDAWEIAYGIEVAAPFIADERNEDEPLYIAAWEWVQAKTKEQRREIWRAYSTEPDKLKRVALLKG